ncbi:hypothetical protein ACHAW5_001749 [Stephanodiscus triporus]|uniref:Pentatricopeptide repeat-containing protein n=1 Tax=Stephanodiscus triporus TaxID=2934178 RepID=A0ABD3QUL6_9STRA
MATTSPMLAKVFLVFQMMRNAGATPDLACYNALLRACALSGDIEKAHDVLRRMKADGIEPTPNTWRGTLKAARKARRSDVADSIWMRPHVPFHAAGIGRRIANERLRERARGYQRPCRKNHVVVRRIISKSKEGTSPRIIERGRNRRESRVHAIGPTSGCFIRAPWYHSPTKGERARDLACEIAGFECSSDVCILRIGTSKKALQLAQDWLHSY